MRNRIAVMTLLAITATSMGTYAEDAVIPFDSDRWRFKDAELVSHLGRAGLRGTAFLKDVEFGNGVIEVDVAVTGARSYPGIIFRMQSEDDHERFYVRPHRAGLYPDALQYTPVFNGVACWQLYHGKGFTGPAVIPTDQWVPLRMEVHGTQARVFINNSTLPALTIPDLKHGDRKGPIGVMGPRNMSACFSNFRYRVADDLQFDEPPTAITPPGTLSEWQISRPYPANRVDRTSYPGFFQIFYADWLPVTAEPSGLVNISRFIKRPDPEAHCVLARTVVDSGRDQEVKLSFGYSDDVTIFLNTKPVFSGNSGYRSRDASFLGVIGLHDTVYLPLRKGLNEICLMVTDSFGGWGFMGQTDPTLHPPVKRHGVLTKVWETPSKFKIPESALYDPERDILYVSNFNKGRGISDHAGFISKVTLDGRIEELEWITDLDGPCGMGIHKNSLFVAESSGHVAEIGIDAGRILKRHPVPGARFLNDLVIDDAGIVYITNSTAGPADTDIYACREGRCTTWKDGDAVQRANGLFIHEDALIVGSTGTGLLKRINLGNRSVSTITSLGAGIIDGIRVDPDGNYLVSHWEGRTYSISPSGDIVEVLDTAAEGRNLADFEFIKDRKLLVIPTFTGNSVMAYEWHRE